MSMFGAIASHYVDGAPGYAATVLALNPLAYWRLDEAQGASTMLDSSGNSRDGTYGGTTTLTTSLLAEDAGADGARLFGTGNYATVPYASWMNPTALSVSCMFVAAANTTATTYLAARGAASPNRQFFLMFRDGKADFGIYNTAGSLIGRAVSAVLTQGTTYHAVGTFNGSTVSLYINGSLAQSVSASGSLNAPTSQDFGVGLVDPSIGTPGYYPDVIDEVATFPTALSAGSISTLYTAATTA